MKERSSFRIYRLIFVSIPYIYVLQGLLSCHGKSLMRDEEEESEVNRSSLWRDGEKWSPDWSSTSAFLCMRDNTRWERQPEVLVALRLEGGWERQQTSRGGWRSQETMEIDGHPSLSWRERKKKERSERKTGGFKKHAKTVRKKKRR